ncbi:putative glycosidase crf2 [Erysiphe necator]|uniref:Crh-like protein n=1 Tax=Uncinula necator TaxID=52586 RepID=A0A0B1P0T4_UNCNE|nr:putative glycosidase crf2 [Erysiphe necator]KHJ31818.1 putative glycoside hydrolase family 16 protein [Erysiphe necator]
MFKISVILAIIHGISSVLSISCSHSNQCPQSTPCCSQYGECGVGAFCLGGCDPISSFSLESCTPAPVCQDKTHTFDSKLSTIAPNTKYLGDASTADWVSSGEPVYYNNNVLLTMAPDTVGTLLASTTYMWYGNVKAKFKTSRGPGVITAFILLSDVKDEIDYEFVGADLVTAQTNYYSMGITNYHNSENITLSNTFSNYHTYEIDWTPDEITWKIDGKVGRTKKRVDTWNATANQWAYPQTPARVQLSLWPGGLPTNGKGTIEWAGGLVDWNSTDIKNNNYYYATFESVEMTCYNSNSGPGTRKGKSYTYSSIQGTNDTVVVGNKDTKLKSFLATGLDPDAGAPSASGTSSAVSPTKTVNTIPGLSVAGGNPGIDSHNEGSQGGTPASSPSSPSSDSKGSPSDSNSNSFSQGDSTSAGAEIFNNQDLILRSSVKAVVVALTAVLFL